MLKLVCILLAAGALALFALFFFLYPKKAAFEQTDIPVTVSLPYKTEWNYRQSINACGPYSAAAAIRALAHNDISSEVVAQKTPWGFRGGTLPLGMVAILRNKGFTSEERLVALSDSEKLAWLRTHLAKNTPIILLGRRSGLLHYVTLIGYAPGTFFVYDPLEEKGTTGMTKDKNEETPGNITWLDDQLLDFWNTGGVVGLYQNYAIVVRKN